MTTHPADTPLGKGSTGLDVLILKNKTQITMTPKEEIQDVKRNLDIAHAELAEAISDRDNFRTALVQSQTRLGTVNAIAKSAEQQLQDWKSQAMVTQQLLDTATALLRQKDEALRELTETIDAHEIESLDCDRSGDEHCNCLRKANDKAKAALTPKSPTP